MGLGDSNERQKVGERPYLRFEILAAGATRIFILMASSQCGGVTANESICLAKYIGSFRFLA